MKTEKKLKKENIEIYKTFIHLMLFYFSLVAGIILLFSKWIITFIEMGGVSRVLIFGMGLILLIQFVCFIVILMYTWYNA